MQIGENFRNSQSRAYQRVASKLTKNQMEKENIPRGEMFKMASGNVRIYQNIGYT